jgi:hypothetical protein
LPYTADISRLRSYTRGDYIIDSLDNNITEDSDKEITEDSEDDITKDSDGDELGSNRLNFRIKL